MEKINFDDKHELTLGLINTASDVSKQIIVMINHLKPFFPLGLNVVSFVLATIFKYCEEEIEGLSTEAVLQFIKILYLNTYPNIAPDVPVIGSLLTKFSEKELYTASDDKVLCFTAPKLNSKTVNILEEQPNNSALSGNAASTSTIKSKKRKDH